MSQYTPSPAYRDQGPYKAGVLLVNSGTPDSLTAAGVRNFLRRLLRDRRTIEVPRAIWCWVLYCIILPLRPARVLPKYRRVWTERGSPLLLHSKALRDALRLRLAEQTSQDVAVELGMLYSTPDVARGLAALRDAGAQRIVVLPLFPQYSGTTNAAAWTRLAARCAAGVSCLNCILRPITQQTRSTSRRWHRACVHTASSTARATTC